jgi:hypothetical protein
MGSIPDKLLMYSVENPLMIISINSWSWGVTVIRLVKDYGELVKVGQKNKEWVVGKGLSGWVESYGDFWVLWPQCVFRCISVVVVEGVCVRDVRSCGCLQLVD